MFRKRWWLIALMVAGLTLLGVSTGVAQSEQLRLSIQKNHGFSEGGQIQGSFTLTARGPQDLTSVTFFMDGKEAGTATKAPFQMDLETGNYAQGKHILTAAGQTAAGKTLHSADVPVEMLSSAQAFEATKRIVIPLLAAVLVLVVAGAGASAWITARSNRHLEPGAARNYGVAGGTICPKCGRPFALSLMSPNLLTGKLARCPHCGKWSVVRRAGRQALAAAEAAEDAGARPTVREESSEEKLRRQIEESRYE